MNNEVEALQTEIEKLQQELQISQNQLARYEQDLRALQNTRTVKATRLLGQTAGRLKGLVTTNNKSAATLSSKNSEKENLSTASEIAEAANGLTSGATGGPKLANYDSWFWERYSLDAAHNAEVWDFSQTDLENNHILLEKHTGKLDIKEMVWFLPPFQHAYYGGVHTILRLAAYGQQSRGIHNRIVIVAPPPNYATPADLLKSIEAAFPALSEAAVEYVGQYEDLDKLAPADAAVATYWTTAYYALRFNGVRRKFYLMQDYEPLFYPAGTSYALAEAPYRFGFYGLTNTISLKEIYEKQYGGQAEFFVPAVNTTIFQPASVPPKDERLQLFFYGRPGQPRNAFELGVAALKKLKERLGDRVRIVTAGADWQPEQYGVAGLIENLGLLAYEGTARLYQECQAGLVMMFTRHPSYLPFELMASGALVVTNHNPATKWMLHDRENCLLSAPSATSLAETLYEGLTNSELRAKITGQALSDIQQYYSDWDGQLEKLYRYMVL